MKISYDYSGLIQELKSDVLEGLISLDGYLYIIRSEKPVYDNYRPIVDYYYVETLSSMAFEEADKFKAVKTTVKKVLEEMEEWNRII